MRKLLNVQVTFDKYHHAPDDYLFTREEAVLLTNRSKSLLERDAWSGNGPLEYIKLGRRVYYPKSAIRTYLSAGTPVRSTTQANQQKTAKQDEA